MMFFQSIYTPTILPTKNPSIYPSNEPNIFHILVSRKILTQKPSQTPSEDISDLPSRLPTYCSTFDNRKTPWMSNSGINCEDSSQLQLKCNKIDGGIIISFSK